MKKIIYVTLVLISATFGLISCSDVELPEVISLQKVSNLQYTVDGRDVMLSWTLPSQDGLTGIQLTKGISDTTSIGLVESYLLSQMPVNTEMSYTVKAMYNNNLISEGQTIRFTIENSDSAAVAYVIPYDDISEIDDDDELAAIEWFKENVENGVILTPADLNTISVDDYRVIWIHIDRVGISSGYANLPEKLITNEALTSLSDFLKEGGNILLTKHATQLITAIGRISSKYAPNLISSGEGGEGTDILTANAVIGSGEETPYDHTGHDIFANMKILEAYDAINGYDHDSYPLEGPGTREDHNSMWDLNAYGFSTADGDNVVDAFENATTSTVLATWGHVTDYCCAGIVEFKPTDEFLGTCIAIGLNSYEWNQNSGVNEYQDNIELLTKNCINYLY